MHNAKLSPDRPRVTPCPAIRSPPCRIRWDMSRTDEERKVRLRLEMDGSAAIGKRFRKPLSTSSDRPE